MTLDDRLRAAAEALKQTTDSAAVLQDYERLEADYRHLVGSSEAMRRLDDEIADLDLDDACYALGLHHERQGRLAEAARWYRKAARAGHANAAVRLVEVIRLVGANGEVYLAADAEDPAAFQVEVAQANLGIGCRAVQADLEKYLQQRLAATAQAIIRRHLSNCEQCLATYAAWKQAEPCQQGGVPARGQQRHYQTETTTKEHDNQRLAAGTVLLDPESPQHHVDSGQPRDQKPRPRGGTERQTLAKDFAKRYQNGESIRAIAASTGRSYGFIHRVLTEAGIQLRQRGGARRRKKA